MLPCILYISPTFCTSENKRSSCPTNVLNLGKTNSAKSSQFVVIIPSIFMDDKKFNSEILFQGFHQSYNLTNTSI